MFNFWEDRNSGRLTAGVNEQRRWDIRAITERGSVRRCCKRSHFTLIVCRRQSWLRESVCDAVMRTPVQICVFVDRPFSLQQTVRAKEKAEIPQWQEARTRTMRCWASVAKKKEKKKTKINCIEQDCARLFFWPAYQESNYSILPKSVAWKQINLWTYNWYNQQNQEKKLTKSAIINAKTDIWFSKHEIVSGYLSFKQLK